MRNQLLDKDGHKKSTFYMAEMEDKHGKQQQKVEDRLMEIGAAKKRKFEWMKKRQQEQYLN